jgi:hypothetical protein
LDEGLPGRAERLRKRGGLLSQGQVRLRAGLKAQGAQGRKGSGIKKAVNQPGRRAGFSTGLGAGRLRTQSLTAGRLRAGSRVRRAEAP